MFGRNSHQNRFTEQWMFDHGANNPVDFVSVAFSILVAIVIVGWVGYVTFAN